MWGKKRTKPQGAKVGTTYDIVKWVGKDGRVCGGNRRKKDLVDGTIKGQRLLKMVDDGRSEDGPRLVSTSSSVLNKCVLSDGYKRDVGAPPRGRADRTGRRFRGGKTHAKDYQRTGPKTRG